ncbi:Hypothetical_protein [Hexamita inflata]|uniref:Hypothetical_protein n=1 Tax=Hexamita inflata TaxID=28002 RepID=A0AA86Q1I7_9EUKA|nr:Hypothetical protein HINF_LOCUS35513 [Hexamita inflata]
MFNSQKFQDHAIDLFTQSLQLTQQQFHGNFNKLLSRNQIEMYYQLFCSNLIDAVTESLNIMQQFSEKHILTGYESKSFDEIRQLYENKQSQLKERDYNKEFEQYINQVEIQKVKIQKRMQLLIEKTVLKAQNQFMKNFQNQIHSSNEMMAKYAINKENVSQNVKQLKELTLQLQDINQLLEYEMNEKQ